MRAGIRGAGSVETTAGEEWVGTAERKKSIPKTTCVKANRTLDAVSDGAFAATRITTCVFVWVICYSHIHRVTAFSAHAAPEAGRFSLLRCGSAFALKTTEPFRFTQFSFDILIALPKNMRHGSRA